MTSTLKSTDQNEILSMIGKFYEALYDTKHIKQNDINALLENMHLDKVLSEKDKNFLDQAPTIEEFDSVITLPKEKKSPGLDGLPIEFYKHFGKIYV